MAKIAVLDQIASRVHQARKRASLIDDGFLCYLLDLATLHIRGQILAAIEARESEKHGVNTHLDRPGSGPVR